MSDESGIMVQNVIRYLVLLPVRTVGSMANPRLGMLFQEFVFLIQIIEISFKLIVGLICCRHQ